jgi:hypothetical protein
VKEVVRCALKNTLKEISIIIKHEFHHQISKYVKILRSIRISSIEKMNYFRVESSKDVYLNL